MAARRYYAHPTNQFWRLLGSAIGEELHSLDYEARLERLAERRIGMWDVIASAARKGSLDQAIRSPGHNPLGDLIAVGYQDGNVRVWDLSFFDRYIAGQVEFQIRQHLAELGDRMETHTLRAWAAAHTR